jgi:hypothetical protein
VSPTRRAAASLFNELGGVVIAVLAWLTCAGVPALAAALGAIGAGGITGHAYMIPAYAAFLGLSVWLLWRSGRARGDLRPSWLGLAGGGFAVVATWLSLGIAPWLGWWSYLGVAVVVAASVWSFVLGRQPGACLAELRYEAGQRERRSSPARRAVIGAAAAMLIAAMVYGFHYSVEALALQ